VRGVYRAQSHPAAIRNRRSCLSPIDALIYLVVGCRLRCQNPVLIDHNTLNRLRITVLPQRRATCRGYDSANGRFGATKSSISITAMGRLLNPLAICKAANPHEHWANVDDYIYSE
jgi:hypothetical protein